MTPGQTTPPAPVGRGGPPPLAPPPLPVQPRRGRGCVRLLFLGCLVLLVMLVIFVIWDRFPSFSKPETSRFDLWPASTATASSSLDPKDMQKLYAYSEARYFFPLAGSEDTYSLKELPHWLAAAQLREGDVKAMTFINTIRTHEPRLYIIVSSPLLLLELNRSAPDILRLIPHSLAASETLNGVQVLGFPHPEGAPNPERWYWAAPNSHTLIVGGQAAVEEVLAISEGKQEGIAGSWTLRPVLKDIEGAHSLELDLVPQVRGSTGVFHMTIELVESILSKYFSIRGRAVALEPLPDGGCVQKLDYQFEERLPAILVWKFFHRSSSSRKDWWRLDAGLVTVSMRRDATLCREIEVAGKKLQGFSYK